MGLHKLTSRRDIDSSFVKEHKLCRKCGVTKSGADFAVRVLKSGTVTLYSWCRACMKDQYALRKDKMKKQRWALREEYKLYRIEKKYRITSKEYLQLRGKQNNLCAICKQPEKRIDSRTGLIRELAVDHNHKLGHVRGLLCTGCNHGLGLFKDNPEILLKAAEYAKR